MITNHKKIFILIVCLFCASIKPAQDITPTTTPPLSLESLYSSSTAGRIAKVISFHVSKWILYKKIISPIIIPGICTPLLKTLSPRLLKSLTTATFLGCGIFHATEARALLFSSQAIPPSIQWLFRLGGIINIIAACRYTILAGKFALSCSDEDSDEVITRKAPTFLPEEILAKTFSSNQLDNKMLPLFERHVINPLIELTNQ